MWGPRRAKKLVYPPTPTPPYGYAWAWVGGIRKKKINHYICIYNYMYYILYTL
nr:MAG TPA: hypothetical protein [Caudoviricetes sp.]